MECVSREFRIGFDIKTKPFHTDSAIALSETEGELSISCDGTEVFCEKNILLLELYLSLKRWCKNKQENRFWYESMDYEENPIITFEFVNDYVVFSSPWLCENVSEEIQLEKDAFWNGIKTFLNDFENSSINTESLI